MPYSILLRKVVATEAANERFDAVIAQPIRCVKVILELFESLDLFACLWSHGGLAVDYWRECESILSVEGCPSVLERK